MASSNRFFKRVSLPRSSQNIAHLTHRAPKSHVSQFVARARQASEAKRRQLERAQQQARLAAASAAVAPSAEEGDSEAEEAEEEPKEEDWTGASASVVCLKEVFADATRAELECALAQARSQRLHRSDHTQTSDYSNQSLCAERRSDRLKVEADLLHEMCTRLGAMWRKLRRSCLWCLSCDQCLSVMRSEGNKLKRKRGDDDVHFHASRGIFGNVQYLVQGGGGGGDVGDGTAP
jgi:hypothetical protein